MVKVRFTQKLKTRRANRLSGSTELVLTAPAVDVTGREYPRGTHMVPTCGGYDNTSNSSYQDVVIL